MNINIITVSGIVDKSPTSTVAAEILYVNFDLAVNTSGNPSIGTQYYAISASGKNAEAILNSVNVGDKLIIIGRPSVDTYMKKDKQVVAVQKVWIDKFELCCATQDDALIPATPIAMANVIAESSVTGSGIANIYDTEIHNED